MSGGRFVGQVALVTGGASGIGLACVEGLLDEGASVVIADRDDAALKKLGATLGERVRTIQTDVSDPAACDAMVAFAVSEFGRLNIAVNNAGIGSGFDNDFPTFDIAAWDRVIAVNLSGAFYSMRAESAAMRKAGGGAIVNTGSVASFVGNKGMASYVAAKHGLAGLTKAAAIDLADFGIRVNCVAPGLIRTPPTEAMIADFENAGVVPAPIPMARAGEASEVARSILFLASSESSYTTGTLLTQDGGLTIQ